MLAVWKGMCRLEDSYRVLSQELEELCAWLGGSQYAEGVREIINILNDETKREEKKEWLRDMLSKDNLFHPKWLGDCYIKDFPSDGTSYPWWNYLARLAKLSEQVLK